MEAVGERQAPADHGNAKATRGICIAIDHGDRRVLVTGAIEPDTSGIKRGRKKRSVVAHEAEHSLNAHCLDVVGKHLVNGRSIAGGFVCHIVPP